jgi:hypothetical protein
MAELGGWRTLSQVGRYAHLAPGHRRDAVERLAGSAAGDFAAAGASELGLHLERPETVHGHVLANST